MNEHQGKSITALLHYCTTALLLYCITALLHYCKTDHLLISRVVVYNKYMTLVVMEVDEIDGKLVQILSTEIHRDGGASLVRDLKEYVSIDSLLKRCSKPKLLAFLENFPQIFEVNRNNLPHVVYLLQDDHVCMDDVPASQQSDAKKTVMDRIIYILKKEKSKDARRNRINTTTGVNELWLLKQCKNQFHRYLRLSGKYIDFYSLCREVTLVGSESWVNLVSKEFILISEECCNYMDGRMFLREDEEKTDVEALASKLIEKVEEDGGTHISVGLLLHRYPELQKNVGGRDLMRLKEENEAYFDRIGIFMRDNQIYLQSKITKEGRMQVDETGLFSVTSSKWGNAFVSMMAHQCRSMLSKEPGTVVAIDLTASVGGITLPLAKTFERVIAIEIDSHRAELCHCNMVEYGVSHNVNIRNEDSVEIISDVGEELGQYPRVVVIDPREF